MMAKSLEAAIMSYRSLTGEWPCDFGTPDPVGAGVRKDGPEHAEVKTFEGKENASLQDIFEEVKRTSLAGHIQPLDERQRQTHDREVFERGSTDIPVGYAHPENQQNLFSLKWSTICRRT